MKPDPYAVLKIRDFAFLITGRLLITLALQIQAMAVGWQIYSITGDPLSLGLVGLAEALPAIGVGLYAGHIADVFDRKRLALLSQAMVIFCVAGLAVASFLNMKSATMCIVIYVLIAVSGLARGFYNPAVFGLVSQIVPRELYGNSSAWNSTLWQLSAILGPILGGGLYVALGPSYTYVGSVSLLIVAFILFWQIRSVSEINSGPKTSVFESISEGLRFVFSNEIILGAMSLDLFAVLFGGAVALLPIFAAEVFHGGPAVLGLLRAAPSIGAVCTATFLAFHPIKRSAGRILMVAVAGFGCAMILFGLSKNFYLSLFLLALSGAFDSVSVFVRGTVFQLQTPSDMKGRVAAVNSIFIGSSNEIGEFESGVMAKLMGTVPSVVFGGVMTLFVVSATAIRARNLRRLHLE